MAFVKQESINSLLQTMKEINWSEADAVKRNICQRCTKNKGCEIMCLLEVDAYFILKT
jgi:hypothetical protein